MAIYTKKGDLGETFLYNGQKFLKSHPLIQTIGEIDSLQAFIGLVSLKIKNKKIKQILIAIEKDLYLIMGFLGKADTNLSFLSKKVSFFEKYIDKKTKNKKLKSFVLPGKNNTSSWFHILRTITRSVERQLVLLEEKKLLKKDSNFLNILRYFNRLSDFFFVLSL